MQPDRRFIWRAEGARNTPRAAGPTSMQRRAVRHPCRVLVVDDDVLIRAQLCALLHGSDYDVETAASGEDALRLLRSYPCDIVITDWQMPVMDGVALCRQVRSMEQREHIYLLMFTVRRSPQELLLGFAAGADDYVVKGTSSEELLARLEKGRSLAHWRATYRGNDDKAGDITLRDAVTGAYNMTYLVQHLPREMARAERYGRSLAVLECEMDDSALGSGQADASGGDEWAHQFVACSAACIRKSDWLVRSGKKEFMIVLPESGSIGARCVARKLGDAFAPRERSGNRESLGSPIRFTVTVMDPTSDASSAAAMRALLSKAESLRHPDEGIKKWSAAPGTADYLSDFALCDEAPEGRNWPAS